MLRIAPLERQKIYQLLNLTGGTILCKKRQLKGVTAWDICVKISNRVYKGYGSYIDVSETKTEKQIMAKSKNERLGDFFNYYYKGKLNTTEFDRLKNEICLKS